MKANAISTLWATTFSALLASFPLPTAGQGSFQNLDFESANLSPIPPGQYGDFVPINDALPGWTGYGGTDQVTSVLQNNFTLGGGSINIQGPDWTLGGIIEGEYTVVLQPNTVNAISAAIAQTGLVPFTARSLQLKGFGITAQHLEVTLDGQTLSMTPLLITGAYTLYGGNITPFSGQTHELRISALPGTAGFYVDSIVFSDQVVPEPGAIGLFGLGGLLLIRQRRY